MSPPGFIGTTRTFTASLLRTYKGARLARSKSKGFANIQLPLRGFRNAFLVLRDQQLAYASAFDPDNVAPFWDVSINYVPINYPHYQPAVIKMQTGQQEFWRVVNAGCEHHPRHSGQI
ncbi:MAG: hypothetical protein WDM89_10660 [Rhizomicrobium sp.]